MFFLSIYRFYTSRYFKRYQEHPNQSSDDKVMVLQSWSKNRGVAITSRRSGLVLGRFLAHFEPIIVGFKAQTQGIEGRTICDRFWSFLKGRSPLLGWKHLRAHILKGKSLKKKEIEENEMTLSLKIVYSRPLSLFLFFCCFSFT